MRENGGPKLSGNPYLGYKVIMGYIMSLRVLMRIHVFILWDSIPDIENITKNPGFRIFFENIFIFFENFQEN
jgi:hypothetical protein